MIARRNLEFESLFAHSKINLYSCRWHDNFQFNTCVQDSRLIVDCIHGEIGNIVLGRSSKKINQFLPTTSFCYTGLFAI